MTPLWVFIVNDCPGGMASPGQATQIEFNVNASAGSYIDISGLLSQHNRRLYRQGKLYHVSFATDNGTPAGLANHITVMGDTWYIRKAHALARDAWSRSISEELALGVKPGRWNDFRVRYEVAQLADASNTVGPYNGSNGEWKFTVARDAAAGSLRTFCMDGSTSSNEYGILEEYDQQLDVQTNIPAQAGSSEVAYSQLITEVSDLQADVIQEDGDAPPYNGVTMSLPEVTYKLTSPLSVPGTAYFRTPFIPVPLGLVKVGAGGFSGRIQLKAGRYKGVAAEDF